MARVPRRSDSLTAELHETFRAHCEQLGISMAGRASELIEADMEANKPATMADRLAALEQLLAVLEAERLATIEARIDDLEYRAKDFP